MSSVSIVEVRVGASKSPFSSNNSLIKELDLQFASKNFDYGVSAAEVGSAKCSMRFAQNSYSSMQEEAQSQGSENA